MVDTQHFCLRWNNYQSSITSAFENLRDDEDFVDVTLACDGKSLKAHRVVLSACSPYFRELLKSTPCKHPVIVLQDVAFSDLHALVEFIYHGEVNVHQRSLSSFLKTAEVLRVSGLTQQADQTERDELSHVRALAAASQPSYERLPDEGFPRGNSPPRTPVATPTPTPTTVQQLLRRAQIRRNERHTPDPNNENAKRPRIPSPPLNNNDATPTDFSMIKNNHLSSKIEGNGLNDDNSIAEDNIKCEPLELTGGNGRMGMHNEDSSDSGAAASDRPPASASSNEHDQEPEHPPTPNFLTPESKLFTPPTGSYNFSMAALTTDQSPLSDLGHGLRGSDVLAGTSQDQEVAEEDGGWQSGATTSKIRSQEPSATIAIHNSSGSNLEIQANQENVYVESNQEFPMIDLLDDINDHMQIVFKTEPMSPKIDTVDDIESRLLVEEQYALRKPGTTERLHPSQEQMQFNDLRCLAQAENLQNLPTLHEVRRKTLDTEATTNRTVNSGTYCSFCQKTFSRAWSLQRHLADTHFYVPQSLSCDQCGRSYKSRNSLVSHKSQYHAKRERKDLEPHCEITY